MKVNRIFGSGFEPVPLLRDHVQQNRTVDFTDHFQILFDNSDVMPVNRTEIFKSKLFEHHAAMQASLDAFFYLEQQPFRWIA